MYIKRERERERESERERASTKTGGFGPVPWGVVRQGERGRSMKSRRERGMQGREYLENQPLLFYFPALFTPSASLPPFLSSLTRLCEILSVCMLVSRLVSAYYTV